MSALHVFSGKYEFAEVGIDAKANDQAGNPLHTGDIVLISHGMYLGTELEQWTCDALLTVIVAEKDGGDPFAMGIKDCGFKHPEWRIKIAKKFSDVVKGEHWPAFGFSYQEAAA